MKAMFCALVLAMTLTGCATVGAPSSARDAAPRTGPFDAVAGGYGAVVPTPVRRGVGNFFNNVSEPQTTVNALLQGKPQRVAESASRFVLNTTFGVVGLFDVAAGMGLPRQVEDFGQTLGYWGVPSGPYFDAPLLGPTTVRDATGMAVDALVIPNPLTLALDPPIGVTVGLFGLRVVNRRSLDLTDGVVAAQPMTPDERRAAYLAERERLIRDAPTP